MMRVSVGMGVGMRVVGPLAMMVVMAVMRIVAVMVLVASCDSGDEQGGGEDEGKLRTERAAVAAGHRSSAGHFLCEWGCGPGFELKGRAGDFDLGRAGGAKRNATFVKRKWSRLHFSGDLQYLRLLNYS